MSFMSDRDSSTNINSNSNELFHESLMKTKEIFDKTAEEEPADNIIEELSAKQETGISILEKGHFIGILFKTFIMIEINDNEILLIDQHAAHERITYERLLNRFRKSEMNSQVLINPEIADLQPFEAIVAEENADFLNSLGFDFDFIGNRDIVIRAIPSEITQKDTSGVFKGALEAIASNAGKEHILVEKEAIYTMACKSSIKANTELNSIEVNSLIERLKALDNPYTCPHGRPVIVRLTRRDLEKLFKRIV